MLDYQESVTTGQTHTQTDGQTDAGQSDHYVLLCFAGDTQTSWWRQIPTPPWMPCLSWYYTLSRANPHPSMNALRIMVLYLVEGECLSEGESPSLHESPAYHGTAGGWGSAGQAEGVGELEATHLHTQIHLVYWGEELRKGWLSGYGDAM